MFYSEEKCSPNCEIIFFKCKALADNKVNIQISRLFMKWFENTVEKGENASFQHSNNAS